MKKGTRSSLGGVERVEPVVDLTVRSLCKRPYPGHKKGCPNYDKRGSCPPQSRTVYEVLDLGRPVYCIWNVFPFGKHVRRMKRKHLEWSKRQCECCLYWQGTARKELNARIKRFLESCHTRMVVLCCPEAKGINVTETMRSLKIDLEWPPQTVAYQVALVGFPSTERLL